MEDERLGELVMAVRNQIGGLAKEIEERTRQIPFLAEQRTSDTKRIAQLQQETVELFKRIEAVSGRIPVLDENIRRVEAGTEKLPVHGRCHSRTSRPTSWSRCGPRLVEREQMIARSQRPSPNSDRSSPRPTSVYRALASRLRSHAGR